MINVFDFDGVLIDSNNLKNQALFSVVEHKINNSLKKDDILKYINDSSALSRDVRLQKIISMGEITDVSLKSLAEEFSVSVVNGYKDAEVIFDVLEVGEWKIVSSGNKIEILEILKFHDCLVRVENVFADLKDKSHVLSNLANDNKIRFFGDAYKDFCAANSASVEFYFCAYWALEDELTKLSRVDGLKTLKTARDLRELLNL